MASEWKHVKFSELCDIWRGGSPRPIHDFIRESGIPWVKIADATSSRTRFIEKTKEFIKPEGMSKSREVFPGDLILSNSATPGLPMFMSIRACIHDGWLLLRNFKNVDKLFCYYLLVHERENIVRFGSGSVFTNLKTDILKNHEVNIPPLPEQRAIVHILGSLDDKIELNRRMNETLEAMARAIFKRWFIDFEFPNENGEPYKSSGGEMIDSPLGPIPKGWEVSYIGDLLQIKRKSVSPEEVPTEFPYIGLEHMPKGSICLDIWGQVGTVKSEKMRFNKGDILFGKLRPYFHKVGIAPVDGVCSTDILVLNVEDSNYWSLAVESVARKEFIDYASAVSTGTRMPRANWEDLKRFKVSIPCGSHSLVLERFDNIFRNYVSAFFEGIYESKVLSMMRDSLLPKLMSGEIRVHVSEKEDDQL